MQNLVNHEVIFLLKTSVRNAFHDAELFAWARQQFEKIQQIIEAGNAVVLTAHDERW